MQETENPPQTSNSHNSGVIEVKSFDEMMTLNPDWIDIPLACFILEKEAGWSTDADISKASELLDALVQKAKYKIRNYYPADKKAKILLEIIFDSGYKSDSADREGHKLENLFLSSVLTRKRGYCLSLSILALSLAYRLERDFGIIIPIKGVRAPKHFFIRMLSENKSEELNFELTDYGMTRENTDFLTSLDIPLAYVASKVFFKPLNSRQIFSDVLSNLGACKVLENKLEEAQFWLEKAISLDESNPQTYYNFAVVREMLSDYTGALQNLTKSLNLDPNLYDALCARGNIYCEKGNPREGLKDFEVATTKYQNRDKAFLFRGVYLGKQGKYPEAEIDLLRAKKLNPLDVDINVNLAVLYVKQEKFAEAVPYLELLLKIAPEHSEAANWNQNLEKIKQSLNPDNK